MTPTDSQAASLHEELARVLALLEKATPTEWGCGVGIKHEPKTSIYCDDSLGSIVATCAHSHNFMIGSGQEEANAAAIAAAINFLRKHGAHIAETFKETPNG